MAGDGDEDGGDGDFVEAEVTIGGQVAEQVVSGVGAAVGGGGQEVGDLPR